MAPNPQRPPDSGQNDSSAIKTVTMGCRLNAYESERMGEMAKREGLETAIIINSCAVTNEAVRQVRQTIRRLGREHPDRPLIVTGCAAQIDPDGFAAMDEVAVVLGNHEKMLPQSWHSLFDDPDIGKLRVNDIMAVRQTAPQLLPRDNLSQTRTLSHVRTYVQIQNGCDHRCTFCIIPYGRGNARSVPMGDVVREIDHLVAQGSAEIILTGVDLSSYGPDLPGTPTLGTLVQKILDRIPALKRLRLSSIDGAEIDPLLFDLITQHPRIAPHIHLSLQAGDDMILKRMKRRHTRAEAVALCHQLKTARPEIALGADLIAGFPTETEAMFDNSVRLIDECDLSFTHIFPFSPRKGTPAARMPQLDRKTIKQRAARLRAAGQKALDRFLHAQYGQRAEMLVESLRQDQEKGLVLRGRLANFTEVFLPWNNKKDGPPPAIGQSVEIILKAPVENRLGACPVTQTSVTQTPVTQAPATQA